MQAIAGLGHFIAGRYDEALAHAETALHDRPNFAFALGIAAASAACLGKMDDASKAMMRLHEINTQLNMSNLSNWVPLQRHENFSRWANGLRQAGLPEGD
jgi:ATP/maltotriose-dependent transcriptional regulator MalT